MRLSDRDIEIQMQEGRIRVEPPPPANAINGITVDLRLDNRFRVFNNNSVPYLDLSADRSQINTTIDRVMGKEILIEQDEAFILHPSELVLANTLEVISIPDDLVGWLDGRSSLARLGLMVHVTAHRIDPGWNGQVVLEFFNSGKLPLALKPGMVICAISFEMLSSPAARPYNTRKDAKYRDQSGPISSRIGSDH